IVSTDIVVALPRAGGHEGREGTSFCSGLGRKRCCAPRVHEHRAVEALVVGRSLHGAATDATSSLTASLSFSAPCVITVAKPFFPARSRSASDSKRATSFHRVCLPASSRVTVLRTCSIPAGSSVLAFFHTSLSGLLTST